jgi:maltose-binding protein MalE
LLTACSDSPPTRKSATELQGTLLIWHPFQKEAAKIFTGFLNDFKQLNPEVQIVSEYVPANGLSKRFIKEGEYGFGPDMMINLGGMLPELVKAGHIQAIPEKALDLSSYFPKTWTNVRYQGKFYGWPLSYQLRVLCYNKAKIKQRLTDKTLNQPPSGLDELIKRARKGYSVGMVSSFEDTFWGMGIFGAKFFDAQGFMKPELEGWAKWLEWLKQADNEPNFILIRDRDILHKAFAQGQLTYYICNSNEIADLKSSLKDNLRVATLPAEPNRPAAPILYTTVMMFNRNSSPNQTNLALKLAEFMTNPEQQIKGIVQSQSFIPSNQKVRINEKLLPLQAVLQKQSQTAVAIPLNRLEPILAVAEQGDVLYQKAIAGDITPSQAAQKLTEVVKQQMNQSRGE